MVRFRPLLPLFLFLFALLIRLTLAALTQFDGLYGQDAFAYFYYALDLRAAVAAGEPPPPFAWPIGYPALVALLSLVTGPQAVAGQIVSLLSGAAIAPLVYLLVLAVRPQAILGGMVAGTLTAVAAELALYSLAVTSDAAGLFWATLSAWLLLRYLSRWQTGWLVATAVALSLAVMTRWVYGLLIIPWGVAALLAAHEAHLPWSRRAAAAAAALLIGVVLIGSQFLGSVGGELAHTADLRVVRWHPANAFKSAVQNSDGFFDYGRPTALYYLLPGGHPAYVLPLFTPFLLLGLWAMRRQRPAFIALLVGWPLTIYLFLAGMAWQNWRFPLALFPPLVVLVGLGVDWVWARLAGRWRPLLLVYCAAALLGSALWAVRDVGNFAGWANRSRQIALSVSQQLPPEATLLAFGLTATVQHYTTLDVRELFSLTEPELAEVVAGADVYLLINPENVQTQWVGKSPAQHVAWLQAHSHLVPIAHYDAFVLYRVAP